MKKIFTLLFALASVGALQAQSYKVLNVHKNGEITQTIKLTDIDSLTVTVVGNEEPDTPVTPDNPTDTHEYVDLGLPSGTLWATCNVGANSPEEYGDYFAWGETEPKSEYTWATYKYGSGWYTLTKYCSDSSHGKVDNKKILDPSDDAAHVNCGDDWCMPTQQQMYELFGQCKWTWTSLNGVSGRQGVGPNGNSIFLPAGGDYTDGGLNGVGTHVVYWTSTLTDNPIYPNYLLANDWDILIGSTADRCDGLLVRPVCASAK